MCAFTNVKVEVGDGGRMTLIAMDGDREAFRLTFSDIPYGVIACPLCGFDFVEAKSLPDQSRKRPGLFDVLTVPLFGPMIEPPNHPDCRIRCSDLLEDVPIRVPPFDVEQIQGEAFCGFCNKMIKADATQCPHCNAKML